MGVREEQNLVFQMWELGWRISPPAADGRLFSALWAALQQRSASVCVCVRHNPYLGVLETSDVHWGSYPGWIMGRGNLKSSRKFSK